MMFVERRCPLWALAALLCLAALSTATGRQHTGATNALLAESQETRKGGPGTVIFDVGGKQIKQVGADPSPVSASFQGAVNSFIATALAPIGSRNQRTQEASDDAYAMPPPPSKKLGKLAVFYPGAGSWGPSVAWIVRLAAHADAVVLLYEYAQLDGTPMEVAKSFDGVPLPKSLQGRIFTIGDPNNRAFRDPDQGADQIIAFYGVMAKASPKLLGNLDVLNAHSTLIVHSEGSFCGVLARERFNQAGLPNVIGKLVVMGGGLGDVQQAIKETGGALVLEYDMIRRANELMGSRNPEITSYLAFVKRVEDGKFPSSKYLALVDLGVGSVVGSSNLPSESVRAGFLASKLSQTLSNLIVNPVSSFFSGLKNILNGNSKKPLGELMDGIMPTALTLVGQKVVKISKPCDHGYHVEDPATIDEWAKAL